MGIDLYIPVYIFYFVIVSGIKNIGSVFGVVIRKEVKKRVNLVLRFVEPFVIDSLIDFNSKKKVL